jgi:hypothetical protein
MQLIKSFLESELGQENLVTAEAQLTFGLICLKAGDVNSCMDNLRLALETY